MLQKGFKFHLKIKKSFSEIKHKKNVDKISASIILENFLIGIN